MRKINELIWHCTATPEGRETSVKEIDRWHKERGWKGIGYHKVVHLDGSVSNGRPESEVGAHVAGRNANTIGYVYVGGVDANNRKKGKDTRTPAQKKTMERLTREAIARYGLKKVSGHSDYANKACPCFNARAEYAHLLIKDMKPMAAAEIPPDVEPPGPAEPVHADFGSKVWGFFKSWKTWGTAIVGTAGVGLADWRIWAAGGVIFLIAGGVVWFTFVLPKLRERRRK